MVSLESYMSPQQTPYLLGWMGLFPFGIAAIITHSKVEALEYYGFLGGTGYGAIILSFLGAVHWGIAMQNNLSSRWYLWSITPALFGMATLLTLDFQLRITALIPLFIIVWLVDYLALKKSLIPVWYFRLRSALTTGAVLSLTIMLTA